MIYNVRRISENKALFLSDDEKFEFNTQTSQPIINFTLVKNSNIDIELNTKESFIIGDAYQVDGVFLNYTKKNPPELTLVITKILKQL